MKLLVKTLKGEKFHVECEPTLTVAEVKSIVVSNYSSLGSLLYFRMYGDYCIAGTARCCIRLLDSRGINLDGVDGRWIASVCVCVC